MSRLTEELHQVEKHMEMLRKLIEEEEAHKPRVVSVTAFGQTIDVKDIENDVTVCFPHDDVKRKELFALNNTAIPEEHDFLSYLREVLELG